MEHPLFPVTKKLNKCHLNFDSKTWGVQKNNKGQLKAQKTTRGFITLDLIESLLQSVNKCFFNL